MTHEIVAADRADAAVKISLEGMTAGYMLELTQITNEMVAAGFYNDASEIARVHPRIQPLHLWSDAVQSMKISAPSAMPCTAMPSAMLM